MTDSGKGDTQRPAAVPDAVIHANWQRTFGNTKGRRLIPEDVAHFTWGYGSEWFLEVADKGNYLWSDPDYGGTNVITPYDGTYQTWLKKRALIPAGRDKGSHQIVTYCGQDVQLP